MAKSLTVNFGDGVVTLSAITSKDYAAMRGKHLALGINKPMPWRSFRNQMIIEGLSNYLLENVGGLCLKIMKLNDGVMYHFYPLSELNNLLTKLGKTPKDFQ